MPKILERHRASYRANPRKRAKIAEATRRRRATPKGHAAHNESNRRYKTSERGRLLSRMHAQLRRVRIASTVCDLTDEQWLVLVEAYEGRCAYCAREAKLTIDHVDPVARGGAHTLSNVVPACRPCNSKKNVKPLDEALVHLGVDAETFMRRREEAMGRLR